MYSDETGSLYGVVEQDGRFFIHTQLHEIDKPSSVKHYMDILIELEAQLKQRGIERYYTMAADEGGFRFNEGMGFRTNLEVWNDTYEIMVKEL